MHEGEVQSDHARIGHVQLAVVGLVVVVDAVAVGYYYFVGP